MSIVEHAQDWSKLAELLPQLRGEYQKLASLYRLILTILALLPPLLIPLEAAKWFSGKMAILAIFIVVYLVLAVAIYLLTSRWVDNVRRFGAERISEDELPARMLDRIERDSGSSGEMSFEEIYLSDGSGLERRTRKQIIYAENDIEVNMDRGQQLFANGNIPLQINMTIVALFCIYTVIGSFFLANEGLAWVFQQALLLTIPVAIYYIQTNFRQHLLNEVLADELLGFITVDEVDAEPEGEADEAAQAEAQLVQEGAARGREDSAEERFQAQA